MQTMQIEYHRMQHRTEQGIATGLRASLEQQVYQQLLEEVEQTRKALTDIADEAQSSKGKDKSKGKGKDERKGKSKGKSKGARVMVRASTTDQEKGTKRSASSSWEQSDASRSCSDYAHQPYSGTPTWEWTNWSQNDQWYRASYESWHGSGVWQ